MNTQNSWTLREILIVAAIGATFGFLYLGWVQVWLISQALFGPVTMDVMMGFWFIASLPPPSSASPAQHCSPKCWPR